MIVATGEGWRPSSSASSPAGLVERFRRPAFVIGLDGDVSKDPDRSVRTVDMGAMVVAARLRGLLADAGS